MAKLANAVIVQPTTIQPGQKVFCPGPDPNKPRPHKLAPGAAAVVLIPATISGAVVSSANGIGITVCLEDHDKRTAAHATKKRK